MSKHSNYSIDAVIRLNPRGNPTHEASAGKKWLRKYVLYIFLPFFFFRFLNLKFFPWGWLAFGLSMMFVSFQYNFYFYFPNPPNRGFGDHNHAIIIVSTNLTRAFRGSGFFSQVGSGHGDP